MMYLAKAKYILRLDDACPTGIQKNWDRIEEFLFEENITPIVGIIPDNQDQRLKLDPPDEKFWERVRLWQSQGWHVALHGYQHLLKRHVTKKSLVAIHPETEFSGESEEVQTQKILTGLKILEDKGIRPTIWMAPAHTFDLITLKVLRNVTKIRIVSDGFSLYPYQEHGFFWLPQQIYDFKVRHFGVWTIALHPNTLGRDKIDAILRKIKRYKKHFVDDLDSLVARYGNRKLNLFDYGFSSFALARVNGLFSPRNLLKTIKRQPSPTINPIHD
jgi:predicted deacetylase